MEMKQRITIIALVLSVCLSAVADDGVQIVTTETLQPEAMHWMANLEYPEYARGGRDWRALIPYALLSGGICGGILAAIFVPILARRDTRKRRKEIQSAIAKLNVAGPLAGLEDEPLAHHRKWPSLRRSWKGYFGSS